MLNCTIAHMFRDKSLIFRSKQQTWAALINQTLARIRKWSICCQVRWVAVDSPNKGACFTLFSLLAKGRNRQSVEMCRMSLRNQTVTKVNLAQVLIQEHSRLKVHFSDAPIRGIV